VRQFLKLRAGFERMLEGITGLLLISMVAIVVLGVVYRKAGASLVWYDEVASIMLAWLTYYGSALAALKRAHIGYHGLVESIPPPWRLLPVAVAELCILSFFVLLAWVGYTVLLVLEGDYLVSLPNVSSQVAQSVIPIGGALYVLAELMTLPEKWREATGREPMHPEFDAGDGI